MGHSSVPQGPNAAGRPAQRVGEQGTEISILLGVLFEPTSASTRHLSDDALRMSAIGTLRLAKPSRTTHLRMRHDAC